MRRWPRRGAELRDLKVGVVRSAWPKKGLFESRARLPSSTRPGSAPQCRRSFDGVVVQLHDAACCCTTCSFTSRLFLDNRWIDCDESFVVRLTPC